MSEGYVVTNIRGHVAEIEFAHPMSNSLPGYLLASLAEQITDAGKVPQIHCILLKSAGDRAFCAGASFEELANIHDIETGKKFFSGFAGVINAIRTCGTLIVARIHGKAVGGGVGITAAADLAFATRNASIRLSELAVGIGPFVIGPAVERKTGKNAFHWLSLTPDEWRSAEWAENNGLYAEVFETMDQLDTHVNFILDKLGTYNPAALQQLKKVFWEGTEQWDELLAKRAEISGGLVLSDFTKNAIAAFKKN
jgi:methylglutaconyl-CoA hydratase